MADNTSLWMQFAQRPYEEGGLGLAKHQAAGIVGNLQNESSPSITPWGVSGDNGTAHGSAQWRLERLDALKSMYPDTYQTPEAQMAFMRHELDTSHNKAYRALQSATSPEEAARAFNKLYEVSADTTGNRAASARRVFSSDVLPDAGASPSTDISSINRKGPGVPALSPDNTMGPGALTQQPEDPWDRRAEGLTQIGAALAGIVNPAQANAINNSILLNKKAAKAQGAWSSHVLPNGQVMQTHSLTGETRMVPGSYAKPEDTPDAQAPQMIPTWGDHKLLGDGTKPITPEQEAAYFKSMNPQQAEMVKSIVENRMAPPTANAMSSKTSPYPAAFAAAARLDPDVDATKYAARIAGQRDWATKGAEQARALNQTIAHQSEALVGAMKGLDNGNTPIINKVGNLWSEHVDGSGKVPAFRTAAHAVVDELGKVFKQNNLSDTEIRKWEENLPASMSPEQQRAQIRTFQQLMSGAMSSLEDKRRLAIGTRAADKAPSLLSDRGREGLAKLAEFATEPTPAAPAPTAPASSAPPAAGNTFTTKSGKTLNYHF
jgi:hypothetical protein